MVMYVDDYPIGDRSYNGNISVNWDTTNVSTGWHTIKLNGVDDSGNVGTQGISVYVNPKQQADYQNPDVYITNPDNNSSVTQGDIVSLQGYGSDNVGLNSMVMYVDDYPIGDRSYNGNISVNWDTTNVSVGWHTIKLNGVDDSGNVGTQGISVYVNPKQQSAPLTITIGKPLNGASFKQGQLVEISAIATGGYGTIGMQAYVEGIAYGPKSYTGSISVPWDTTGAELRTHTIRVQAIDSSGNPYIYKEIKVNIIPVDSVTPVATSGTIYTNVGNAIVYGHDAVALTNAGRLYVVGANGSIYKKQIMNDGTTNDQYVLSDDIYKGHDGDVFYSGDPSNTESAMKLYWNRSPQTGGEVLFSIVPKKLAEISAKINDQSVIWNGAQYCYEHGLIDWNRKDAIQTNSHNRADTYRQARTGVFSQTYWNIENQSYLAKREYGDYHVADVVLEAQKMLVILDYTLKPDGKFGPMTFNALANIQIINDLSASGQLDQATYDLLKKKSQDVEDLKNKAVETPEKSNVYQDDYSYILGLYSTLLEIRDMSYIKYGVDYGWFNFSASIGKVTFTEDENSLYDGWGSLTDMGQQRLRYLRDLVLLNPKFYGNETLLSYHVGWLKQVNAEVETRQVDSLINQVVTEYNDILGPEISRRNIESAKRVTSITIDMTGWPGFAKSAAELFKGSDLITNKSIPLNQRELNLVLCALPVVGGIVKDGAKIGEKVIISGEKAAKLVAEAEDIAILKKNIAGAEMKAEVSEINLSTVVRNISGLESTANFKLGALEHILEGELNVRGKAVGYHYEGFPTSKGRVISGTETSPNSFGVYKAKVEVNGVTKTSNGGYSSFFPKNWTPQKVIDSINEAFANKTLIGNDTYTGFTADGMNIMMYLDSSGQIKSAFPIY